ncbi:PREDICTED: activating transcription factor of chaperone isoform X2 [Dinoponera quadriceps]|uniref:Activating transcription factor of chaperone isoform X2 n=1 Tax=Dinoponera quadriceps TaxID=609295 RepID=A0A6P3WMY9_DINQU|nr:PREDICTED: activating transcription factor of chaperone isoform X2 [Dinoponera quadriceps]
MAALCYSESFSNWMEQRTYIPIFEELSIAPDDENPNDIGYQTNNNNSPLKPPQNTQTLLEEFETVLGDVEACHQIIPPNNSSTLTPPQSPPPSQQSVDTQLLITLQPVQQSLFPDSQQQTVVPVVYEQQQQTLFANSAAATTRQWDGVEDIPLNSVSLDRDAANELMAVEEYVRSHANDIPSPSSPCTSSGSSCISTEDLIDDPDWNIENESSKPSTSKGLSKTYRQSSYRPSVEDRKVRKKEQNKNAATRYRQKKKQEIKDILVQEIQLTETNKKLKKEVVELKREVKVVKNMMREMFKARGVLQ